jgi:hypothetical protein
VGDKLVPLNFMSHRTHLSNFACDKKVWPDYMTFGNLLSKALPDSLNAQSCNGHSPTDSDQERDYSSEADGLAAANKPKGAE